MGLILEVPKNKIWASSCVNTEGKTVSLNFDKIEGSKTALLSWFETILISYYA